MCKIATFTNSKNLDVQKVAKKVGNILLDMERDGFGYAVQGVNGVFGEKCVADTFKPRMGLKNLNPPEAIAPKYLQFGQKSKPIGALIMHGRTSTNDHGLVNCHPMVKQDHYLVHNGVVTDHGKPYEKATTNDSEDVLHRFLDGIASVEKHLTGYYAFSCIDSQGRLHVVRDRIATLYMVWLPKLDTYLIATTESLIHKIADALGLEVGAIDAIKDDVHLIFEGNQLVHCQSIKSRGYDNREAALASKSLGRELSTFDDTPFSASDYFNPYEGDDYNDGLELLSQEAFDREVSRINDTFEIFDVNDRPISAVEFHKLDSIAQRQCLIYRPDGSCIEYLDAA